MGLRKYYLCNHLGNRECREFGEICYHRRPPAGGRGHNQRGEKRRRRAVILSDEVCRIENIPGISDVAVIVRILYELGAGVKVINKSTLEIDPRHIDSHIVPADLTKRMRASSYFMGAMLGRFSKARIAPPGGCDFGVRPIDQHIKGFEALGAKVVIDGGMAM